MAAPVPGRGSIAVYIDMVPNAFIIQSQMIALGSSFHSFKVPLQKAVDTVLTKSFRSNFDVGGRPPWVPLSEATVAQRAIEGFGGGPILVRTGALKRVAGSERLWTVTEDEASATGDLGDVDYGVYHQRGTSQMPARPWAVIQDEDLDKVEDVFIDWFRGHLRMTGFIA